MSIATSLLNNTSPASGEDGWRALLFDGLLDNAAAAGVGVDDCCFVVLPAHRVQYMGIVLRYTGLAAA